jgi:hypothetical protein
MLSALQGVLNRRLGSQEKHSIESRDELDSKGTLTQHNTSSTQHAPHVTRNTWMLCAFEGVLQVD